MSLRERTRPGLGIIEPCLSREGRHVAKQLAAAADGGDIDDVVVSLRLVLQLEQVPCLPQ